MIEKINQAFELDKLEKKFFASNKTNNLTPAFLRNRISSYETSYEKRIYYKMLSPKGLEIAEPYLKEEENVLKNLVLKNALHGIENIIVIGAGPLRYLEMALNKNYIAIDKVLNVFLRDNLRTSIQNNINITLINKPFEEVKNNELPNKNSLYIFTFNVVSYINNFLLYANKIAHQDNIIFISGWNDKAQELMSDYFNYIYANSAYLKKASSFVDPHKIDFSNIAKINSIVKHEGKFTKSITVNI